MDQNKVTIEKERVKVLERNGKEIGPCGAATKTQRQLRSWED